MEFCSWTHTVENHRCTITLSQLLSQLRHVHMPGYMPAAQFKYSVPPFLLKLLLC